MLMRAALALAALPALPALLAVPALPAYAAPGDEVTAPLTELISDLPVQPEGSRDGYSRDRFRHWVDEDRDGCNTRAEVLLQEAVRPPEVTGRCTITAGTGQWYSWYDEETWDDPADLDIDHVVPLAEAWDSGAAAWTAAERRGYANDLGDERSLAAVTDNVNQAKGDKDVAEWTPPAASAVCRHTTDSVVVKTRWGLSTDEAELAAINRIMAGCPDETITVTIAR